VIAGVALGALLLGATGTPEAAALEGLAAPLTTQILQAAPDAPVAIELQGGPNAEGLFTLLAAKLAAARMAPAALPCDAGCDDAALRSGARTLVRLTLTQTPTALRVDGELHGVWRNFWAGARDVRPTRPAAALHASVVLAAPQSPLPPGTAHALSLRSLAEVTSPLEALAAADLDGDGTDEVLALTDHALLAFDQAGQLLATHPLDALPQAAEVSRDPIGTLAVEPSPLNLLAFSQNRARGERLAWDTARHDFQTVAPLTAPRWGCGGQTFEVAFTQGENTFEPVRLPSPFPRIARRSSALSCRLTPKGLVLAYALPAGTGQEIFPGGHRALTGVGAGIGWADVDGDGTPELLTSSALLTPETDTLSVAPLSGPSQTLPVPGRILFLTAARRAGQAREAIVVAHVQADGKTALGLVEEVAP